LALGLLTHGTVHNVAATNRSDDSHKEVVLELKPLADFVVYIGAASKALKITNKKN
jgi:hypothetical protein